MDDIKRQIQKRFEQQANAAGWRAHLPPISETETLVPIWLYSVNPISGPRIFGQLSLKGYRDVKDNRANLRVNGREPWDVLNAAIVEFDAGKEKILDTEFQRQFLATVLHYARCTSSWKRMPNISEVPGLHIVVVDWQDKKRTHLLRAVMAVQGEPLGMEQLSAIVAVTLDVHLTQNPDEAPML